MEIKITNDGVKGVDAITIFKRNNKTGDNENHHCIEGGETWTTTWDITDDVRYEIVPWLRVSPSNPTLLLETNKKKKKKKGN